MSKERLTLRKKKDLLNSEPSKGTAYYGSSNAPVVEEEKDLDVSQADAI